MPPYKTKIILNPNADRGNAWRQASDLRPIVEEFGGADWAGTVYPTHAVKLAEQAALEGYELIISVGGDGTIHEVINGVMRVPAEKRPRIGVVPMGSGNDFAHAVGMQDNPALALRQIFTGTPRRTDLAVVTDEHGRREYIDNTLGAGFNATVTIRSRTLPSFLRGFIVYFTAVVQTIILNHDAAHIQFRSDQQEWEDDILMLGICNGPREGGGFRVAPDSVNNDGVLNYVAISKVSRPMMFRLLPEVMNGTHGNFKQVRLETLKQAKITSDRPLNIHIDGEIFAGFGTDVRQLDFELVPGAIEVVV
ncbi:MAG: diacylglycerol kinase family lipid kinase [Chloroflexi bacterium]|jgi:YegS/Rv2252/BmrU family lipid kinase|nr:diacylglycerol kinase family lipid kinase [Chloroflexota bacterium]